MFTDRITWVTAVAFIAIVIVVVALVMWDARQKPKCNWGILTQGEWPDGVSTYECVP